MNTAKLMLSILILNAGISINNKAAAGGLFDPYEWPLEYFDSPLDKVAYESHGLGYSDNCLFFASNVQKKLKSDYNISSRIYYVIAENKDHAVVCDDKYCVDNGFISDSQFDRSDLGHYNVVGEVRFADGRPYVMNEKGLIIIAHWDPNFRNNRSTTEPSDVSVAQTK